MAAAATEVAVTAVAAVAVAATAVVMTAVAAASAAAVAMALAMAVVTTAAAATAGDEATAAAGGERRRRNGGGDGGGDSGGGRGGQRRPAQAHDARRCQYVHGGGCEGRAGAWFKGGKRTFERREELVDEGRSPGPIGSRTHTDLRHCRRPGHRSGAELVWI